MAEITQNPIFFIGLILVAGGVFLVKYVSKILGYISIILGMVICAYTGVTQQKF